MTSRESRIILYGLAFGAAVGGLAVMLMRIREDRRATLSPEPLRETLNDLSWPEVFSIVAAGITLARRIGGLPPPPGQSANR